VRAKRWLLAATATAATITSGVLGAPLDILAPPTDLGGSAGGRGRLFRAFALSRTRAASRSTILYAAPPRAPQLENVGVWKARPILISGASAYRKGEFLYQDYLYDDHGANGGANDPTDAHVAASAFLLDEWHLHVSCRSRVCEQRRGLVELRLKPRTNEIVFRVTLNSLKDPARIGFTLAIGESAASREFPNGANVRAPAALFLTVHGQQAEFDRCDGRTCGHTNADRGWSISSAVSFEVHVATAAWNPRISRCVSRPEWGCGSRKTIAT